MTPGEAALAQSELERARTVLSEAKLLLDADAIESAASRLYYAVFHASRAALVAHGRYAKTHSGGVTLFEQLFGPAPVLARLLELRQRADYELGEVDIGRDRVAGELAAADEFIVRCAGIVSDAVAAGPDEPDPPPDL